MKDFLQKYLFRIIFSLVGLFGGICGVLIGFLAGFFVDSIILRKFQNMKITEGIDNPDTKFFCHDEEPFTGAFLVSALVILADKNEKIAEVHIKSVFPEFSKNDWISICRNANKAQLINPDFITECLASKLKDNGDMELINKIVTLLEISEFAWNDEISLKPSVYLTQLLNLTNFHQRSELSLAYQVLNVKENSSISEIKQAHKKLVKMYHPDSNGNSKTDEFMRIQRAYDLIIENRKNHLN